jgi:Polyketide synthase dehydratase
VYPPPFHGPAFQVVAAFGRIQTGLGAVLAAGLPLLSWGAEPTVLQPRLLELLLQCCGIHELARAGRMMVPAGIEAVYWHPGALGAGRSDGAMAIVRARPGPDEHSRVFDGQVLAPGGTVLVTVTGYRAAGLGHAADPETAARLTRRLAARRVRPALADPNSHPRPSTTMTAPLTTRPAPDQATLAAQPDVPRGGYPDTRAFCGFFAPSRIEADVYDLDVDGQIPCTRSNRPGP